MTTGQLLFYAGVALLGATVILAIAFLIKKPKYVPESATYSTSDNATISFRSGYPTDRMTIRRDSPIRATELLNTNPLDNSAKRTEMLEKQTELLEKQTELLIDETEQLNNQQTLPL